MTRRNPPCYRCESDLPLEGDRVGLCRKCDLEVRSKVEADSLTEFCPKCGHLLYNDWERVQHEVNRRHNYRSWTSDQGEREAARLSDRKPAA